MTALYMDGFDHYGIGTVGCGNMLDGAWAQAPADGAGSGPGVPSWGTRTGLFALRAANSAQPFRYILPSSKTRLFVSLGYATDGLPGQNFQNIIMQFSTSGNTGFARLWCQADGSIALTNGSNTTVLAATQGPILTSRNWAFLEMDMDATNGNFTLRVNDATASGTPVIQATGLSFTSSTIGMISTCYIPGGSGALTYIDDLFIRDSLGTVNNSWLGDRRIAALFANSDTSTTGWTPSYYQRFGPGILTLGFVIPNDNTVHNNNCAVWTPTATSLNIGSGDFTIEGQVRFDGLPGGSTYSTIFSRWDSGNSAKSYRLILGSAALNGGSLQFDISTDGTTTTNKITYPWTPVLNTWYHIAICRSAGQLLLFVNGQQFGLPITDSATYFVGGAALSLGGEMSGTGAVVTNTTMAGRMDETRFTNGVSRYTGPFTPPAAAFPRGSGSDPDWAQVVWLMGYDSAIIDESGFLRTTSQINGAAQFTPGDGPAVGVYSTVNKANPDDNTFISAGLTNATNVATMTTQPSNGNTVTVGTTNGTTAAVYIFKTTITSAYDVLIDTTAQGTLINFLNAVNAGTGAGTKYGTGTLANFDVNAVQLPVGQIEVVANLAGTAGNSIASTRTGTAFAWASTTLTGGAAIPGPTDFLFSRPPNNTTIISAFQTNVRALKTDAGTATIQTAFIGPLGGTASGASHNLTITPDYYSDMIELDPDTSGPLSPTSIVNGKFQITRTA